MNEKMISILDVIVPLIFVSAIAIALCKFESENATSFYITGVFSSTISFLIIGVTHYFTPLISNKSLTKRNKAPLVPLVILLILSCALVFVVCRLIIGEELCNTKNGIPSLILAFLMYFGASLFYLLSICYAKRIKKVTAEQSDGNEDDEKSKT
jgi:hypothetical protein